MLLGISGVANTGKDTSADFLVDKYNFVKISFADPIKKIARDVFDFSETQLWGPSKHRNEPDARYVRENGELLTARLTCQTLGTSLRECYKNVWIEYTLRIAKTILDNPTLWAYDKTLGIYRREPGDNKPIQGVVIPDCRFKNEVDILKDKGATVLRITRPGSGLEGLAGQHPSEKEQELIPDDAFHYVVHNDGTIPDLYDKLDSIFSDLVVSDVMGKDQVVS